LAERYRLCAASEIDDPGSRGFTVDAGDGRSVGLFVVRKDGVTAAYRNACPHTGAPLEWVPDQFLDIDKSFIECALHGALFRPEDGYCLRGPCVGKSLQSLTLTEIDGELWVDLGESLSPGPGGPMPQ
jgi:nitrite reductase/ring-hydroxylating ferredoxin subunit